MASVRASPAKTGSSASLAETDCVLTPVKKSASLAKTDFVLTPVKKPASLAKRRWERHDVYQCDKCRTRTVKSAFGPTEAAGMSKALKAASCCKRHRTLFNMVVRDSAANK